MGEASVKVMADYGTRSEAASLFTEVVGIISVVEHSRSHVEQWMRPTKLTCTAPLDSLRAEVQPVSPATILPRR
jgi:coniferyl-aldehyde dehydrogenase